MISNGISLVVFKIITPDIENIILQISTVVFSISRTVFK